MAKATLAGGNSDRSKSATPSGTTPQSELLELFPKRTRKSAYKTSVTKLEERLKELPVPTYQATDDDLPLIFWPEPEL
jgi:hypothetical protein